MLVDAIILAGGRSARLDSIPKSEFVVESSTLLQSTLLAVNMARSIVVVGPEPPTALGGEVTIVREEPPFGGPVAAVAAGFAALSSMHGEDLDAVIVLACDMPHVVHALPALLAALSAAPGTDGSIAIDQENRQQPLAAVYRASTLGREIAGAEQRHALSGKSMFRFIQTMNLLEVSVPLDATADVDTWDDAAKLGATPPAIFAIPSESHRK